MVYVHFTCLICVRKGINWSPVPAAYVTSPGSTHRRFAENLSADSIQRATMHTQGSASPSGLNSFAWWWLCSSNGAASHDLCFAQAADIPLNKCPGVRPSEVVEMPGCIIAKAYTWKRSRGGYRAISSFALAMRMVVRHHRHLIVVGSVEMAFTEGIPLKLILPRMPLL